MIRKSILIIFSVICFSFLILPATLLAADFNFGFANLFSTVTKSENFGLITKFIEKGAAPTQISQPTVSPVLIPKPAAPSFDKTSFTPTPVPRPELPEVEPRTPSPTPTPKPITKETIIREIISSPSGATLASIQTLEQKLNQAILTFDSKLQDLRNTTPTILRVPSSNTGSSTNTTTLNPNSLTSNSLTVNGSGTLDDLTITRKITVGSSTITIDGTNNKLGIGDSTPETNFEVVGTASISGAFNTYGAITFSGTASHSASGEWNFDSNTLVIDSGTNRVGIGTTDLTVPLEVVGAASISGTTTLRGVTYTWPSADGSASRFLQTNGSGALSWAQSVTSNSLDFDEIVNSPTLDANLTINRGGYYIGLGSAPSTVFEVQGTASASYFLTGNTLQVGGFASAAYNRFGTSTATSSLLSTTNDLLISGNLEVDSEVFLDSAASISGNFQTAGRFILGDNGDTGEINTSDWDISNTGNLTGIGTITADGLITISGGASSSTGFEITTGNLGINAGNVTDTRLEVGGTASISGATTLRGVTYTWPSADGANARFLQTNGSGALAWAQSVTSNSLDFDEIVNSPTLDANLNIQRAGYYIGIGAAPQTVFEVQGTASASYLLTGNTLQVGGFSSAAYSRFGTATATDSAINTTNDLLISGALEVDDILRVDGTGTHTISGLLSLSNASVSGNFELTGNTRLGVNSGGETTTSLEVGGTASISGTTTLRGITYTWPSADGSSGQQLQTNGTGTLSWAAAGGVTSNSIDFDEIVSTMLLDSNLTINRGGYYVGLGAAPSTVFEVQGTASASYLLTGNTLQVGGFSSTAYSRFGTSTTGHSNYISTTNDVLVSGDIEVRGTASFGGVASISGTLALKGVQYTFPSSQGKANSFLKNDGSGNLSWAAVASVSVDIFTTTGANTWTKPTGAQSVTVVLVAGSGGGGSGRRGAASTSRYGGGGGSGGSWTTGSFPASILGATETVTVGAAGTGGAAVTTNDTDGNAGTGGGVSSFGSWLRVNGPGGGAGGTATTGIGGSTATVSFGVESSGRGGAGGRSDNPSDAGDDSYFGGAGGGNGGRITSADAYTASTAGGANVNSNISGGAAGANGGGAGGAGTATTANNPYGARVVAVAGQIQAVQGVLVVVVAYMEAVVEEVDHQQMAVTLALAVTARMA